MTTCYSDHNEDIRTKGSCDYCHGTEPDTQVTHTPGPWTVQINGDGSRSIAGGVSPDPVTHARYLWVADVKSTRSDNPLWRQEEESEANAQLIAAAPDLLAALLSFLRAGEWTPDFIEDFADDVRHVVSKLGYDGYGDRMIDG